MIRTYTSRATLSLIAALSLSTHLAHAADRAGVTTKVQTQAYQEGDFLPQSLFEGEIVYRQANITTDRFGSVSFEFDDGSTMTVGPDSDLIIDNYVYDPDSGDGQAAIRLGKGILRMVSGRIPSDRVQIRTPVATVGIRGTEFALDADPEDLLRIWIIQGTVSATVNGSGQSFAFDAPSFAECTSDGCVETGAPSLPVTQPPTTGQIGGEATGVSGNEGAEEDDSSSDNL